MLPFHRGTAAFFFDFFFVFATFATNVTLIFCVLGYFFMHWYNLRREWGFALPSVTIGDMAPLIRHGKTFSLSSEGLLRPLWGFCPPITVEPKGGNPHSMAALKPPVALRSPCMRVRKSGRRRAGRFTSTAGTSGRRRRPPSGNPQGRRPPTPEGASPSRQGKCPCNRRQRRLS